MENTINVWLTPASSTKISIPFAKTSNRWKNTKTALKPKRLLKNKQKKKSKEGILKKNL